MSQVSPPAPPRSDIVRFGGGALLVIVGLLALGGIAMTISDLKHWAGADTWVATDAEVTATRVDERVGSGDAVRHTPIIEFTYVVDGVEYHEDNHRFVEEMTRHGAEDFINAHKRGTTITIYYDPDEVDHVELDNHPPPVRGQSLGFLVPSLLFVFYFSGWLVPAWLADRRARRAKG